MNVTSKSPWLNRLPHSTAYDQKLLDIIIIISLKLCSLNLSALVKTEPSELLTLIEAMK